MKDTTKKNLSALREYAVTQIRAASKLLELCEDLEKELADTEVKEYSRVFIETMNAFRRDTLNARYGMAQPDKENLLWYKLSSEL